MHEFKNLVVEPHGETLLVKINRERALNALNRDTIDELQQFFSFFQMMNSKYQ